MAFLNFKKKRGVLQANFDLDIPPEPPKIGIEDDFSPTESPDEELMPYPKSPRKQAMPELPKLPELDGQEFQELPPLPDMDDENPVMPSSRYDSFKEPEFPALPEEQESESMLSLDDMELPPLPKVNEKKQKKGFLSFLKSKKEPEIIQEKESLGLSSLRGIGQPDLQELPELPSFHSMDEELESEHDFEEESLPAQQAKPEPPIQIKPQKEKKIAEAPITRFVTLDEFKSLQDSINSSKSSLKGIDSFFSEIDSDKIHQDKKYESLYSSLQDIHRKILFIGKTLFKEV